MANKYIDLKKGGLSRVSLNDLHMYLFWEKEDKEMREMVKKELEYRAEWDRGCLRDSCRMTVEFIKPPFPKGHVYDDTVDDAFEGDASLYYEFDI